MKANKDIIRFWAEFGANNPNEQVMAFVVANGNKVRAKKLVIKANRLRVPVYEKGKYKFFKGQDLPIILSTKRTRRAS
jgi:hypothetical protein